MFEFSLLSLFCFFSYGFQLNVHERIGLSLGFRRNAFLFWFCFFIRLFLDIQQIYHLTPTHTLSYNNIKITSINLPLIALSPFRWVSPRSNIDNGQTERHTLKEDTEDMKQIFHVLVYMIHDGLWWIFLMLLRCWYYYYTLRRALVIIRLNLEGIIKFHK